MNNQLVKRVTSSSLSKRQFPLSGRMASCRNMLLIKDLLPGLDTWHGIRSMFELIYSAAIPSIRSWQQVYEVSP